MPPSTSSRQTRSALARVLWLSPGTIAIVAASSPRRDDRDRRRELAEARAVEPRDRLIADAEGARAPAVQGPDAGAHPAAGIAQQPLSDEHGVVARGRRGPQQPRLIGGGRQGAQ